MMGNDDSIYTIGWLKGDYTARFEALYRMMYKRLYAFACNFLRDEDVADDIVQDVFTGLWTKGRAMRDDIVLEPYLQTAIKNLCIDYHRRLQIEDRYQQHALATEAVSYTHEEEEEDERIVKLRKLMKDLPEMQRRVVELSTEDGLSYREIAERLNIAEGTVHTHIKRAYKFLKQNLMSACLLLCMLSDIFK